MKYKEVEKKAGINLQLFADADPVVVDPVETVPVVVDPVEPTSFTKEELESEADKRVSKALETARSKWQIEQEGKLEEVERLAKLSESEKTKELEKQRVKDLEDRENALTRKQLELDAVEELSSRKLPTSFKNMVIGKDAEETLENIKNFDVVFRESVKLEVDERLKTTSPDGGGGSKDTNGIGQRLADTRAENTKPVADNPYFK